MKIIAYDRFKPGVALETVTPYLPEEVANVGGCGKPESSRRTTPAPTSPA